MTRRWSTLSQRGRSGLILWLIHQSHQPYTSEWSLSTLRIRNYLGNTNLGSVIGSSLFIADFADYKLQYYRYASVYSVAATDVISTGTFHDLVIGKSVYVDSTFTYSSPNTYIYDVSQTNIMLFKSGRGNPASFRCSYFKLYDGEILVRDFIPVRFTNEQGMSEGAMYDKVSRQLFRNAGTGQFMIGPDVGGGGLD